MYVSSVRGSSSSSKMKSQRELKSCPLQVQFRLKYRALSHRFQISLKAMGSVSEAFSCIPSSVVNIYTFDR